MFLEILSYIVQGVFTAILWFWWVLVPILLLAAWQNHRKSKWAEKQEHILLTIKIPKSNEKDPTAAEMMFASLHGILKPKKARTKEGSMQEYLSFEMLAKHNAIHFYVGIPIHLRDFVESQIYAQYPSAEINEATDYTKNLDIDKDGEDDVYAGVELGLKKDDIVPIKTFQNFKVDPLAGITSALAKLDDDHEQIWIQILTRPMPDEWQKRGLSHISAKKSGRTPMFSGNPLKVILTAPFKLCLEIGKAFFVTEDPSKKSSASELAPDVQSQLTAIEEKITKLGFQTKIRIISLAKTKTKADQRLNAAIGAFNQFNTINLNSFTAKSKSGKKGFLDSYRARAFFDNGFILNIEELASVYHLPHTSVETPNIDWTSSKTGEPPIDLPTILNSDPKELTIFAETNFRHARTQFGSKIDDRRRHTYVIGKSGMGKTKLLETMIQSDIDKGTGFAIIDPNGDLIVDTLKKIPKERMDDVILLDPADAEWPIAFNTLEIEDDTMKHFVAQGFVGILQKLFGHSWGPRLEYILNYTILALLDYPDSTVLGIVRMLTDKNFRKRVVAEIKDPVVKKFWTTEFSTYNDKFASEAVAPILNKVGQFTASSMIRNIIGQRKSSFDVREAMDTNKILLINLSTGKIGEVNSSLLGGMIITKIQLAAMSRASVPHEERIDFSLYVDEFQHFATESFATILSEARKYKLSLTVANQYVAQMDETVRDAVFGNVGTIINFRVGAQDAAVLEKELNPPFESGDIINLDRQQIYIKMTIDGKTSSPFSAKTITVSDKDEGNTEEIINLSRKKYSHPRKEVEAEINRWSNVDIGSEIEEVKTEKNQTSTKTTKQAEPSKFTAPMIKKTDSPATSTKKIDDNLKSKTTNIKEVSSPKRHHHKNNKINTSNLKEAIRSATVSETAEKKVESTKEDTPKKDISSAKDKSQDKKTLRKIISRSLDKTNDHETTEKEKDTVTHAEQTNTKTNNLQNINDDVLGDSRDKKHTNHNEDKTTTTESHRKERTDKIITPKNFKELKEIHPHEKVVIKNKKTTEVKEGETIKFKSD